MACYHNNNYIEGATPNKDIINLLIENGADVNARSLYRAINQSTFGGIKRTPDTINVLLDAGVDIHGPIGFHGDNALLAAAREQYSEAVEILLQHGADINSVNDDNLSFSRHSEALSYLRCQAVPFPFFRKSVKIIQCPGIKLP